MKSQKSILAVYVRMEKRFWYHCIVEYSKVEKRGGSLPTVLLLCYCTVFLLLQGTEEQPKKIKTEDEVSNIN